MPSLPLALLFAPCAAFLALPVWWAWRFVWLYYFRPAAPPRPETDLPRVAVILPLRGVDPSLRDCLRGLLSQDYPHYSLRIVIDSLGDPAWDVVPELLAEGHAPHVEVRLGTLQHPC